MTQAAVEHYLDQYARLQPQAAAAWLDEVRASAIEDFRRDGFPTTRHENWKYTDVSPIIKRLFVTAAAGGDVYEPALLERCRFPQLDCHELVFINGTFSPACSNVRDLDRGVILGSIAEELHRDDATLRRHLSGTSANRNAFEALNSAFVGDGCYLSVPEGVCIDRPIHLLFLCGQLPQPAVAHLRNLIVLGDNSRAAVIETYAGSDNAEYFTNTITEIEAGCGAQLEHYKLQQEGQRGYHVGSLRGDLKRDSRLESHSISLGGALVRNNIDADLNGTGAALTMNGLYIASGKQHVDNHTCVQHRVPNTASAENYRGVLDGRARGVFNGRVVVHEQAQKTDAQQSNANLLLSDHAEVDTKPELEIYANDVKCSHGATVGQLDENMLFYLRSRAIEGQTARSLLTFAFAEEVIKHIRYQPVRDWLEQSVVGKLPDTDLIRGFIK